MKGETKPLLTRTYVFLGEMAKKVLSLLAEMKSAISQAMPAKVIKPLPPNMKTDICVWKICSRPINKQRREKYNEKRVVVVEKKDEEKKSRGILDLSIF